ncbi:hypothetical protein AKJ16_DCAP11380 [Drosera capensis]
MLFAATSPPPPSILAHHRHHVPFSHTSLTFPSPHHYSPSPSSLSPFHFIGIDRRLRFRSIPTRVTIAQHAKGEGDYELRKVLELATYSELYELERILFGPSYFSPLIKSIWGGAEFDHIMIEEDLQERDNFIDALESRFLFLAADARSTLRGWRPSYRNVLLDLRKKLNVPCSSKLPTEDLEVEIFVHFFLDESAQSKGDAAALRVGTAELQSMLMKGGHAFAFLKMSNTVLRGFSSKMILNAAKGEIEKELVRKAGQLASINLEKQIGSLAARKGLARIATRFLGLRSLSSLLGPLMLGTLLADAVILMLGTDYARVLQAIYVIAQMNPLQGSLSIQPTLQPRHGNRRSLFMHSKEDKDEVPYLFMTRTAALDKHGMWSRMYILIVPHILGALGKIRPLFGVSPQFLS